MRNSYLPSGVLVLNSQYFEGTIIGTCANGATSYNRNVNVNRNGNVNQGWGAWGGYYRPGVVAVGVANPYWRPLPVFLSISSGSNSTRWDFVTEN
ncbi:MAG: hypothetical protein ACP5IL_13535 [Syntrophobacteraceae bacterium]